MVASEFLAEFRNTQDLFTWKYVEEDQIRGFLKTQETDAAFDPIAALLFARDGRIPSELQRNNAGKLLGLSAADLEAIQNAAADTLWKYVDDQLVLDGYSEWFRGEIALVVGLELDEAPQSVPNQAAVSADPMLESGIQLQHI